MKTTRRVFLKQGAMAFVSTGLLPAFGPRFLHSAALAAESVQAGKSRKKTLVCLFQRGAVDGLSLIVPHGDPFYYQHRRLDGIAIARTGSEKILDLDGFFGLHPAMGALKKLYDKKQLAAVQAVGSPHPTRSHFDAQEFMETAILSHKARDGWLARTLLNCPEDAAQRQLLRSVALTGSLPRSLQGAPKALAVSDLRNFGIRAGAEGQKGVAESFEALYDDEQGDILHGAGRESFEALKQLRSITKQKYFPANHARYPQSNFGRALQQIAQLIKADVGLEIAFAESGGWDTHINQGNSGGTLARRLNEFSEGIAALHTDLGDRMNDVVILTMSEFGRTVRQNGNNGTDHGHGTCFLVLGGDIEGGKVHGDWPGLAPEQLYENRDLAVTTDFRDIFAEIAQKHLNIQNLDKIFTDYPIDSKNFRQLFR